MKLFWRKKQKEVTRAHEEVSVVKVTQSASTEESSNCENPANNSEKDDDVLDELVKQGYDPENGGRLMLLDSISYEDDGDRYAMKKSTERGGRPEQDPQDEYSDDEYSWDDEVSRDRDSTFYTVDKRQKQATRRSISGRESNRRSNNVVETSWSLKSAGTDDESKIYHSMNSDPLASNSSFPSFLDRVKSTPLDLGPADPPGQFFDKYNQQIIGVRSNEVSVLSMKGAEEIGISESAISAVSNISSSGRGSSTTDSSSILPSSLSDSVVGSSGDSSMSDDNNPWRWLSRPAASFRARRKKDPIVEESPRTLEYNKHRKSMKFQSAPSFVTGTFVSEKEKKNHNEGAVECMIVPDPAGKNLPPTPRRRKQDVSSRLPDVHSRGHHFKAVQEYWKAKESSNGHSDIPRPPTFDPEFKSNLSMEEAILMQALSMGGDVIPVPPDHEDATTKTQPKKNHPKEEKLGFIMEARSKEDAVEVAMEKKQSRFSKLKSKMSSTSSSAEGSRSSNNHKMTRSFFRKKKKAKYFEGVLDEDDMVERPEENLPRIFGRLTRPDPISVQAATTPTRFRGGPLSPQSPSSASKNQKFDVPPNIMIHPDLGQDTMEEERMADELVGFVKLMPVALMSFFRENPNEDELIRSLQPKGRSPERRSSMLKSSVPVEDPRKPMNFVELHPSPAAVRGDVDSEVDSDRTEKRRGGILKKLVKKKDGNKAHPPNRHLNMPGMPQEVIEEIAHVTRLLKTPRMTKETIEEMAEKEVKQKSEEGVEMIAGITKQGKKAIVISNTKRHPVTLNPERVYHA